MSESKGNEPAFSASTTVVERFRPESGIADKHYPGQSFSGLTKREWFAGMALQGLLSKTSSPKDVEYLNSLEETPSEFYARTALGMADALLAELEKK